MCTVIVSFHPNSQRPLVVGANRDESPTRPSTPFELRNETALYPLDVGGGTWVGMNDSWMFGALTNRDDVKDVKGRKSRGALVTRLLSEKSVRDVSTWADKIDASLHNGFRLIAIDRESFVIWEGDGKSKQVKRLDLGYGLHVISGFGVDTWDIPRCRHIRDLLSKSAQVPDFKHTLGSHFGGTVDTDVCVHDANEHHLTVSSCVIEVNRGQSIVVHETTKPPCQSDDWKKLKLSIYLVMNSNGAHDPSGRLISLVPSLFTLMFPIIK